MRLLFSDTDAEDDDGGGQWFDWTYYTIRSMTSSSHISLRYSYTLMCVICRLSCFSNINHSPLVVLFLSKLKSTQPPRPIPSQASHSGEQSKCTYSFAQLNNGQIKECQFKGLSQLVWNRVFRITIKPATMVACCCCF